MSLTLFTQPQCPYCDMMKSMLDKTGFTYYAVNVKEDQNALNFMKEKGHRTVPQLYYNRIHINTNPITAEYTPKLLEQAIGAAMEGKWPGEDSGVEHGI